MIGWLSALLGIRIHDRRHVQRDISADADHDEYEQRRKTTEDTARKAAAFATTVPACELMAEKLNAFVFANTLKAKLAGITFSNCSDAALFLNAVLHSLENL